VPIPYSTFVFLNCTALFFFLFFTAMNGFQKTLFYVAVFFAIVGNIFYAYVSIDKLNEAKENPSVSLEGVVLDHFPAFDMLLCFDRDPECALSTFRNVTCSVEEFDISGGKPESDQYRECKDFDASPVSNKVDFFPPYVAASLGDCLRWSLSEDLNFVRDSVIGIAGLLYVRPNVSLADNGSGCLENVNVLIVPGYGQPLDFDNVRLYDMKQLSFSAGRIDRLTVSVIVKEDLDGKRSYVHDFEINSGRLGGNFDPAGHSIEIVSPYRLRYETQIFKEQIEFDIFDLLAALFAAITFSAGALSYFFPDVMPIPRYFKFGGEPQKASSAEDISLA